ncbi:MAG TPA: DUF6524 family protein [Steroidobacteraceae bacterium]|nr:DUF6524 family protein [Steroidobacteraceae bacterium]
MPQITFAGFAFRMVAAIFIVFATFNPTGHSYAHWVAAAFPKVSAVQVVAGIVLLILWVVLVVATMRSIGRIGVFLVAALFAALTWLAFSMGWLSMTQRSAIGWIALFALAFTLAIGSSWSFINRRLFGQVDTDTPTPR